MAPVLPPRLQPLSEEGDVQSQEQQPETRRDVITQPNYSRPGLSRTSPTGSFRSAVEPAGETESFDISTPVAEGLIKLGVGVMVKHDHLPDNDIIDYIKAHANNRDGEDSMLNVLSDIKKNLKYISENLSFPMSTTVKLSNYFKGYDRPKMACFLFMGYIYTQLAKGDADAIKQLELLVFNITGYIFESDNIKWVEGVFDSMSKSSEQKEEMKEAYKKIIGSDLDLGVLNVFNNLDMPSLEQADEVGITHSEGAQPKQGEESEEEASKEEDEEKEPSEEEGEADEADEEETFEKQKKLSDTLKEYRESLENVYNNYLLKPAKASYEAGKDLTVLLAGETIKVAREVLKYIIESPAVWLGFLFFAFLGDYFKLYGEGTMFDYMAQYTTRKTVKAVVDAPPIKFLLGMLGNKIKYADPEVDMWTNTIHRIKGGLVGEQYGMIT